MEKTFLTILFFVNIAWNALLSVLIIIKTIIILRLTRNRTYALIIDDNNEVIGKIKVDTSKRTFRFKNGSYLIRKPYIKHESRKYLIYRYGHSEPINFVSDKYNKSILAANELDVIIESEILQRVNRPKGLLGGLSFMKIVMIIGGLLLAVYIFTNMGAS